MILFLTSSAGCSEKQPEKDYQKELEAVTMQINAVVWESRYYEEKMKSLSQQFRVLKMQEAKLRDMISSDKKKKEKPKKGKGESKTK